MTTVDHSIGQHKPFAGLGNAHEPPSSSHQPLHPSNNFPLPNSSFSRNIWRNSTPHGREPAASSLDSSRLQKRDFSSGVSSGSSNASSAKTAFWVHQPANWDLGSNNHTSSPYDLPSWRRPADDEASPNAPDSRNSTYRGFIRQGNNSSGQSLSRFPSNVPRLDTRNSTVGRRGFGGIARDSPTSRDADSPSDLAKKSPIDPSNMQDSNWSSQGFLPFDPNLSQGLANPYRGRERDLLGLPSVSPTNDSSELPIDMHRLHLEEQPRGFNLRNHRNDPYAAMMDGRLSLRNPNGSNSETRRDRDTFFPQQQVVWGDDGPDSPSYRGRLNSLPESTDYTWLNRRSNADFGRNSLQEGLRQDNLYGLGRQHANARRMDELALQQHLESENRRLLTEKLSNQAHSQQSYLPPHMQHSVAANLRRMGTYPLVTSVPSSSRSNSLAPYLNMTQGSQVSGTTTGLSNPSPSADSTSSRSLLLEEFKSNLKGGRNYELRDIYDHIVEFSGDQNGSRFIQTKLETANSEEKERVFREIQPNAIQLMMDVFGNYVIQKFFEYGDQNQKRVLTNQMRGHVLSLSLQVYGCRVVQTALRYVLVDQQAAMVKELERDVIRCVKDQNGNHVIQKAIECCRHEHIDFIIAAFIGQLCQLSTHQYGCRVVQRLLERCSEYVKGLLLQEIFTSASSLITDPYGNYVAQNVIEQGGVEGRTRMLNLIKENLISYSKQKFASNVVEQMIKHGSDDQRREVMLKLSQRDSRGDSALPVLMRDQYGNYVIQKLLDTLDEDDYRHFVELLNPELSKNRKITPNKHVEVIAKKMNRFDKPSGLGFSSTGLPNLRIYPIDNSTVPTPPLTSDGEQTPRSSSVPSTSDGVVAMALNDDGHRLENAAIQFKVSEH